jgi:hypothetical protein
METSTTTLDGDGDIKQKHTTDQKILAMKRNASNRRIFMLPGQRENNMVKLGNEKQSCGIPPLSNWWRKDPRSIPKVFLIDAYEVS